MKKYSLHIFCGIFIIDPIERAKSRADVLEIARYMTRFPSAFVLSVSRRFNYLLWYTHRSKLFIRIIRNSSQKCTLCLKQTALDLWRYPPGTFCFLMWHSVQLSIRATCRSSIKPAPFCSPHSLHVRLILCHCRVSFQDDCMRLFIDHPGIMALFSVCDYVSYCFNYRSADNDCATDMNTSRSSSRRSIRWSIFCLSIKFLCF